MLCMRVNWQSVGLSAFLLVSNSHLSLHSPLSLSLPPLVPLSSTPSICPPLNPHLVTATLSLLAPAILTAFPSPAPGFDSPPSPSPSLAYSIPKMVAEWELLLDMLHIEHTLSSCPILLIRFHSSTFLALPPLCLSLAYSMHKMMADKALVSHPSFFSPSQASPGRLNM